MNEIFLLQDKFGKDDRLYIFSVIRELNHPNWSHCFASESEWKKIFHLEFMSCHVVMSWDVMRCHFMSWSCMSLNLALLGLSDATSSLPQSLSCKCVFFYGGKRTIHFLRPNSACTNEVKIRAFTTSCFFSFSPFNYDHDCAIIMSRTRKYLFSHLFITQFTLLHWLYFQVVTKYNRLKTYIIDVTNPFQTTGYIRDR